MIDINLFFFRLIIILLIISIVFLIKKYIKKNTEKKSENNTIDLIIIPDSCPHCKNPNTKKIRLCEWCGNQII